MFVVFPILIKYILEIIYNMNDLVKKAILLNLGYKGGINSDGVSFKVCQAST